MVKRIPYVLLLTTILAHQTLSQDHSFASCTPQNCGKGPNISYPFWIANGQESYCGRPNFVVTCKDQNPLLTISGDDYFITDVFYANSSLLLTYTNLKLYNFENPCPIPLHNFSIEGTPFEYSDGYGDLFFFYNCTSYPVLPTLGYPIDCASDLTHFSFAAFHKQLMESNNYSIDSCQTRVNAPVEAERIEQLLGLNFTDVLRKGFVLQWSIEDGCSDCKAAGGRCGYANDKFTCFCSDRPHSKTCLDDSEGLNVPRRLVIEFGVAGLTALVMALVFFLYHRRFRKRYSSSSSPNSSHVSARPDLEEEGSYYGLKIFSYAELEEATHNFDPNKELGDGGFGSVYQGKLRDGRVVAIKRFYEHNCKSLEQFMNEVEILTRLRHQNLVSLYGCTSSHSRQLLLVYEYVPNGTVADHLNGGAANRSYLPWTTRMSIAIETASALAYLHACDIIHRDVKTSNLLLDNNLGVKVADFGLSREVPTNVTHVSTAPQGTPGYVDPEYHECYQLTDKSDVYSFGVVMVELISSKPAVDIARHRHEINLSNMAINKIQNNALHELVDPGLRFGSDYRVRGMIGDVAELAFQCLQNGREMRPSMERVLEVLKGIQRQSEVETAEVEEVDIPADDVVLLKSDPPTLSPDSATAWWINSKTTPCSSSS
ncbi:Non-specific serine/threonine protein kinase [Bertholletia excelsa]